MDASHSPDPGAISLDPREHRRGGADGPARLLRLMRAHAPWFGLLVAAAAYYPRFSRDPTGVALYPHAAECLLRNEVLQNCEVYFTYPPAFAFLMIPFVPLPIGLRTVLWYVITIAATVACLRLCEALAGRLVANRWSEAEVAWFRIIALVLSLRFILAVFESQAYDMLVFVFVLAGLWGLAGNRSALGAGSLAVAAALKATPLIFLPYLLLKRRFLPAAVFSLVFLAVSLLPDLFFTPNGEAWGHYFLDWLSQVAKPALGHDPTGAKQVFWMALNIHNHSLRGMVSALVDELNNPAAHARFLYAAYAVFIAAVGVLLVRSPRRADFIAVDGSIVLIAMLMLSPMTSRSHYVVLLLPYSVVTAVCLRDQASRWICLPVLLSSFVLATATSNDLVGEAVTDWAYGHGFLALGAMVLLIALGCIRAAPDESGSSAVRLRRGPR